MTTNATELPQVFVSYSHRDETLKDDFLPHIRMLAQLGQLQEWHDRDIGLGEVWFDEIVGRLERCAVAILLISANFLASGFCTREEVPPLLERRRRDGIMLAPILIRPCNWKRVPWLSALQMFPRDDVAISALPSWRQDEVFAEINEEICKYLETRDAKALTRKLTAWPEPEAIDIVRLPTSGYELVGRDDELNMLNDAFDEDKINVVSLVASGGVGKSTLVNKWCEYLSAENYRGSRRVFAWSFYSQGTNERVTSADQFIADALTFFGDADPTAGSPWAKGERLADLVRREKALLILDGLEPLQDTWQGIKDPSMQRLVEELARDNAGLCVITTRELVNELADFPETTLERNLEQISAEAGRALLKIKGVRGTDAELEQASRAFGNHALAVNLLASFLRGIEGHRIREAAAIPDLDISDDQGRHPRRVMEAFAQRFAEGPEFELLQLLGLFDRPADTDAIAAIRRPPAIPRLTVRLCRLSDGEWLHLVERLRASGLIAPRNKDLPALENVGRLQQMGLVAPPSLLLADELDAHPLVREHFGARLKADYPEAWRAGHGRLYEHLKKIAKPLPDTLAEMATLFQAMHHGCQAGRHQEALEEVYWARITRGDNFYATRRLGAFGASLAAIAGLFDPPFEVPVALLTQPAQGAILNEAAFALRALGRLREAVAPMRAALRRLSELELWESAATIASNLSELHLMLGDIAEAVATGEASVDYAGQSRGVHWRIGCRTSLADALHQAGSARARPLFEKAEALLKEQDPQRLILYGIWGYRYCDLLLADCRAGEARERAAYTLKIAELFLGKGLGLLDIGLDHLSLGRAELLLGEHGKARVQLDQAVDGLRQAGQQDYLARGFLARATLLREIRELAHARRDLDEAMRIARRSEMRLFQCDAHLEYARLALAEGDRDQARGHLAEARRLVEETGYGRRRSEVEALEAEVR